MTRVLEGRLAVVTGASRGIGRAAAIELAKAGAHVIALARVATLVPADVTDYSALDRLGAAIHQRWGKLDILIGNAGILGDVAPLPHVDPATWEKTLAVNVTANWRLIRSLDPLLRASEAGRAIFVTSGAAHNVRAYRGPYTVSKAALEALAGTYAAGPQGGPAGVSPPPPPAGREGKGKFFPFPDPRWSPPPPAKNSGRPPK